jgi:hypothetical protein
MSITAFRKAIPPVESLHALSLGAAALGLLTGLVAGRPEWVNAGISLVILLPPLRLVTTILAEARRRRLGVATMGVLVLAFLIFSRRIS